MAATALDWRGWSLVIAVALAVCCFELGDARALTEHEIYVAGGAKQMALEGGWLLPKIGDHFWLEKPPLLHWLVVVSATLCGGFTETAVRLPSALAGVGVVALMTALSARWFGARVGIATGLLQSTTVYFLTYARLVEADMLLTLMIVAALFVFARLQSIGGQAFPEPSRNLVVLFWALVGLSNLAKGPGFGMLLILTPCLGWLLWQRDPIAWRRMVSVPGFLFAVAIGSWWPIFAAWSQPEARELWRLLLLERAATGAGYAQPWWYYLLTPLWQMLPWTGALLLAAGPSYERVRSQPNSPDRFLWCWAILPIALLSLSRGKHHHYIIAALCGLSPLLALGVLRCGMRVAAATIAATILASFYVHARVLPARDPSGEDRVFLQSVRGLVPAAVPLAATGGPEIARHIFYVAPPLLAVWNAADLRTGVGDASVFYVVARQSAEAQLRDLGAVVSVAQSRKTRRERSAADRYTLFRIEK